MSRPPAHAAGGPRPRPKWRLTILALAVVGLLAGLWGGLGRAGIAVAAGPAFGHAVSLHAALMIVGFLGTVIGIERAVALRARWAFVAPLASGLAALALLCGATRLGARLAVLAALVFTAVCVQIVRRQNAPHTVPLVVAALAWLAGNLVLLSGRGTASLHAWWFAFLVVTIAAERLEMTRLMRRHPGVQVSLVAVFGVLLGGAAWSALDARAGGLLYGAALVATGLWLLRFDIARRTVRGDGLSRYMAIALLAGHGWLVVGGLAWAASALGLPARDLALHAVGLGFVFSTVMAHAPVILPAIARVKLRFGSAFYVPLALLHGSLLLRLGGGIADPELRATGAALNAAALALFAITVAGAAVAQRRREAALASIKGI